MAELSVTSIIFLAAVDAVNPCALAVLTLLLVSILTYNPREKRNVLLAGLSFTLSVFILYMLYGLVIIRFFQMVSSLAEVRVFLYQALGVFAAVLGVLNMKNFFWYSPGGILTEMPMSLRPRVKRIIDGVTSPKGAFIVGAFVTVFLLPCTIGPYLIAGGILSFMEILATVPWLLLYNLIFVLPMIGITLVVYVGMREVGNVSGWKDRNIRYLHLVSGIVMLSLGIAMATGILG
jgi:hypothetical protein